MNLFLYFILKNSDKQKFWKQISFYIPQCVRTWHFIIDKVSASIHLSKYIWNNEHTLYIYFHIEFVFSFTVNCEVRTRLIWPTEKLDFIKTLQLQISQAKFRPDSNWFRQQTDCNQSLLLSKLIIKKPLWLVHQKCWRPQISLRRMAT